MCQHPIVPLGIDDADRRESAIVVAGERLEEHVSPAEQSRCHPQTTSDGENRRPGRLDAGHRRPTVVGIPPAREPAAEASGVMIRLSRPAPLLHFMVAMKTIRPLLPLMLLML